VPKRFSEDNKSVRVKDQGFAFNEFREEQKKKASEQMVRSVMGAVNSDPKAEAKAKNRAKAKKATKK